MATLGRLKALQVATTSGPAKKSLRSAMILRKRCEVTTSRMSLCGPIDLTFDSRRIKMIQIRQLQITDA